VYCAKIAEEHDLSRADYIHRDIWEGQS
jgi:hypothetical protein